MAVRADPARPATRRLLGRALGLFTPREWTKLGGMHGYFLTQQGVHREDVMNGVRDIETKARLEAHMDERKTGEDGYRRRIVEVRAANPAPPSRPSSRLAIRKLKQKRWPMAGWAVPALSDRPLERGFAAGPLLAGRP